MASHNRNPTGKNQHAKDDEKEALIKTTLEKYHRQNVANLPKEQVEQLVLDQLDKDPAKRAGVGTIWNRISHETGYHLRRDTVSEVMHTHDADAFAGRDPTAKEVHRAVLKPSGTHEWWSGDGHDKLKSIGFALWMMVDGATTHVLDGWIVPNNRLNIVIAFLFLCLVEKYKGVPLHANTDCGSETTLLYGIVNAFRIHNIAVERSWKFMRYDFGDNAVLVFQQGIADGIYDEMDPDHYELCQWLWSRFLQLLFNEWKEFHNGKKIRTQHEKVGPSVKSRAYSFLVPSSWGGQNLLQPIEDMDTVRKMKEELGGDALIAFNSDEYKARAEAVYVGLGSPRLTLETVWDVFQSMLPSLRVD
ncbi:hypothetical protein GGX14DRAFT_443787 [Mycena pura]|uniref:Uncharacterized protein n=1 Tax=Mycena pura TaxID=153505 RepID=A0AAD6VIZ2_9AGAR|nr:hypothetical protein GGX14DRAFT_443787 [Mycena pura]